MLSFLFEDENLRHVLADELGRHHSTMRFSDSDQVELGCSCGHDRGSMTKRELAADLDGCMERYRLHVADALLLTLRAEEAAFVEDDELAAWEEMKADQEKGS